VSTSVRPWARALAAALALMLGVAFVAPPRANAGEVPQSATPGQLTASVAATLKTLPTDSRAVVQQTAPAAAVSSEGGRSFFKTPGGAIAIALMAAGTGYMIYSASHDRKPVRSPIR
jgi:hypothetical protein